MNYNYVIFGAENELYRVSYSDLEKCDYAYYLYERLDTDSKILTFLYRLHTSPVTNKLIKLPFQSIWNNLMFRRNFNNNKPICFIFFAGKERIINNGLVQYLKKKYPSSKYVMFYQDLVSQKNKNGEVFSYKESFDLLLTFDQEDAKKYGMVYYPLVYSKVDIKNDKYPESDVYFVGKAKDRLDDILKVYDKLMSIGLKCDFHITGVPEDKRKYADKIDYCSQISYTDNIKRILASKCILEIMQKNGHGYTLRACEAVTYGKKLLTNNPEIANIDFYNPSYILKFTSCDEIVESFFDNCYDIDYKYAEKLSPLELLHFIDHKIVEV